MQVPLVSNTRISLCVIMAVLMTCYVPCIPQGSPKVCSVSADSWHDKRWRECGGGLTRRQATWSWSHHGSPGIWWQKLVTIIQDEVLWAANKFVSIIGNQDKTLSSGWCLTDIILKFEGLIISANHNLLQIFVLNLLYIQNFVCKPMPTNKQPATTASPSTNPTEWPQGWKLIKQPKRVRKKPHFSRELKFYQRYPQEETVHGAKTIKDYWCRFFVSSFSTVRVLF